MTTILITHESRRFQNNKTKTQNWRQQQRLNLIWNDLMNNTNFIQLILIKWKCINNKNKYIILSNFLYLKKTI